MGFQMEYVDFNDVDYPQSYWHVSHVIIDQSNRTAEVAFNGYENMNARDQGRPIIGQKKYILKGQDFEEWMSSEALNSQNPVAQSYQYSKIKEDWNHNILKTKGINIGKFANDKQSFFEEAIDV